MSNKDLTTQITSWLFETEAVKVSPAEQPFWYTSGLIGPYYVNTHFLFGGEQAASKLLKLIDDYQADPAAGLPLLYSELKAQYEAGGIFRKLTDALVTYIKANFPVEDIDYISGGERRDWFFSLLPAEMLGKPHLVVYKDKRVHLFADRQLDQAPTLQGTKALHIADLVTEASSYLRAWIPALETQGVEMPWTVCIVDRRQGGREALRQAGVTMHALVSIEKELFAEALSQGYLGQAQFELVNSYLQEPFASMQSFLREHPEFLEKALAASAKEQERAKRLIEQDLYRLKG